MLPTHRPPTHPGEMLLEEFLKPLGLAQTALARELGIPLQRLNEIVHGRRGVSADTALRLATHFKMSPEFWLGLQMDWDLWHAQRARLQGKPPKHSAPTSALPSAPPARRALSKKRPAHAHRAA